jgi:hypothetical protein
MPSIVRTATRRVQSFFGGIGRAIRGVFRAASGAARSATRRRRSGMASQQNRRTVNTRQIKANNNIAARAATAAATATPRAPSPRSASPRPSKPPRSTSAANSRARTERILAAARSRNAQKEVATRGASPVNEGIAMKYYAAPSRRKVPPSRQTRRSPGRTIPRNVKPVAPPVNSLPANVRRQVNVLKREGSNDNVQGYLEKLPASLRRKVREAIYPGNNALFGNN